MALLEVKAQPEIVNSTLVRAKMAPPCKLDVPPPGHGAESGFRESSEKMRHVLTSADAVLRSNVLSEIVIVTAPL